ncbi:MAG: prolipoprotein diacylglyceryl transferase [Gammaproteobacteria bacterium]|nr:prolipoprotein diacylglyceryl transferase [Gammaproteobacteria bacterium]
MLTYPNIDPVAISLGSLKIHWYGLMYLIGFVAAWKLGMLRARHSEIWTGKRVEDLIFYGALGVVLGGRIGYTLFYSFATFAEDPVTIFYIWKGGMSFHGGLLGVITAFYLFARNNGMSFFQVSDFMAPMVPIGLGAGRIGNFINKELIGRPMDTAMPWAMDFGDHIARHPSSLYQALSEGVLLFIIVWIYSSKQRPLMAVSAVFVMTYGLFRFVTEFFRTPDAHLGFLAFDWLTMGQLLSLPMMLIGLVTYALAMKNKEEKH